MDPSAIRSRAIPWFVFVTVVAALSLAREFLVPIVLAAYIAFVFAPLVRSLTRRRVPRALATSLILGGAAIVVVAIASLLVGQVRSFADSLPEYRANLREKAHDFHVSFGGSLERASSTVRELGGELTQDHAHVPGERVPVATDAPPPSVPAGDAALSFVQQFLGSAALLAAVAALIAVLAWVMLYRWDDLRDRMLELAGRSEIYVTTRAASEASAKVTAYVRKQLLVNAVHGSALALLLWWIGVPNPLVWGILAAALRFVPYLGPTISAVAPILVSLASTPGWARTWETAGALLGLEILTNYVAEPLVYGAATGVSSLALLVSAAFWTWIWGPVGLVLSTPLTVCLLVVGKHFPRMRVFEILIGDQPAMPAATRLYHRLLAGDQDEAWTMVHEHAAQSGELETVDDLLLPALVQAGHAVRQGVIDADQRERVAGLALSLASELEESRRTGTPEPPAGGPRILCISARDTFDAVGSRLFALELANRGLRVSVSGEGELLGETLERIQRDPPCVVCISSVAPTHFLQVRSLCKRLLRANDDAQIIVGLWGEDIDAAELEQRLPASPRLFVATTLAQAIARAATLATTSSSAPSVRARAQ